MKKAAAVLLMAGVLLLALLLSMPWSLPDLSGVEPFVAMGRNGTLYLAKNDGFYTILFGVDETGTAVSVYRERNLSGSRRSAITAMTGAGDQLYFVRQSGDADKSMFDAWQVGAMDVRDGTVRNLMEGAPSFSPPDSVTVEGESLYLTFRTADHASVSVYQTPLSEVQLEFLMAAEMPEGTRAVGSAYGDGILYSLLGNGKAVVSKGEVSTVYPPDQGAGLLTSLSVSNGRVLACDSKNRVLLTTLSGDFSQVADVPAELEPYAGVLSAEQKTALLAIGKSGNRELVYGNGADFQRFSELEFPFALRLLFKQPLMLAALAVYGVFFAFVLLMVFVCGKSRRLAARMTAVCTCSVLLLFFLMSASVLRDSSRRLTEICLSQADQSGKFDGSLIEQQELSNLGSENFYGSQEYINLLGILEAAWNSKNGDLAVASEILLPDGSAMAVSATRQTGLPVSSAFSMETQKIIEQVIQSGAAKTMVYSSGGKIIAWDVRPVFRYGKAEALLVTCVQGNGAVALAEKAGELAVYGLISILFSLLLLWLVSSHVSRPLRMLARQMKSISDGNYDIGNVTTGKDEVGDMWRAMQEMSVSLAIKEYETQSMVDAYSRFVPRELEKLLDRASVMEVTPGDMTRITGNVGLLAVENREEVRGLLDDGEFMRFVNGCFTDIDRNVGENNGLLLSGDFNLSSLPAYFPKSADDGVKFALNQLGEAKDSAKNKRSPDYFLLLHTADSLYGVAGTQARSFAFLSSSELDFLGGLSVPFRGTGVQLVVTEQYLKAMEMPCASRYLGFAASPDGRFTFKLYELLDVCSDVEKKKRLSCNERFQNAIEMFYKNDFYLARNEFSSVLRICPEDGIARWYLFACESFFHSGNLDQVKYNLFGNTN